MFDIYYFQIMSSLVSFYIVFFSVLRQASSLVYFLLLYAEDNTTQHMEILLQGLYKASQDENEQVVKQVINIYWDNWKPLLCHVQINILLKDTQTSYMTV